MISIFLFFSLFFLPFSGKSDPMVVARAWTSLSPKAAFPEHTSDAKKDPNYKQIGSDFTTEKIKDTLNPEWNAYACFKGEKIDLITFDIYDKDKHSSKELHEDDDSLGRSVIQSEDFTGTIASKDGEFEHHTTSRQTMSGCTKGCALDIHNNDKEGDKLKVKMDVPVKKAEVADKATEADPEATEEDPETDETETETDIETDTETESTEPTAEALESEQLKIQAEREEEEALAAKLKAEQDVAEAKRLLALEKEAARQAEMKLEIQRLADAAEETARIEDEKKIALEEARRKWKTLGSVVSAGNAFKKMGENAADQKEASKIVGFDADSILDPAEKCEGALKLKN